MTENETEKSTTSEIQKAIKPVDIARQVLVWQWVLDPKGVKPPEDLTKEELVEVYYNYRESLTKFTEVLNRIGQQNQMRTF